MIRDNQTTAARKRLEEAVRVLYGSARFTRPEIREMVDQACDKYNKEVRR